MPNTAADTWGSTHNGQYQSSGRWYFNGSYVGVSQAEYDIARANYWGLTHNGQFENQSRWYFGGSIVATTRTGYKVFVADAWGVTHSGQYNDSGRYYYTGAYVGGYVEYINAQALAGTRTGLVAAGRYYYCGSYVGDYNAYVAAADTWGSTHNGGYGVSCDPLADRYYHNGILVYNGAITDTNARDTAAMYLALADAWGSSHNGQYLNSGRWYFNGSYVGASEIAYLAAEGTYWGTVLNGEGQWQSSDVWYHDGALVGPVADYADFWGLTHNGQFESCGRWYFDGVYVGGSTEYFALENGPRHPYAHGSYYSDDETLVDGVSLLYTGKYNNTLATNVSFTEGLYNVTTNGSGVVALVLSANWYDDSSDAHHAVTLNGTVTQSNEGGGVKAASFDSSSLKYTANDTIGTQDFTLEFFVKSANATPGFREDMFSQQSEAGGGFEIFKQSDGTLALGTYLVSVDLQSTITIADTNWHHIAVVGVAGEVSLFIDGIKDSSVSRDYTGTGNYVVGYGDYGPVNFNGKIAGLRMVIGYALYTSNFSVPTTLPTAVTGTQLLLNFGATAVPTIELPWYADSSNAHHAVTLSGSVTQGDEGGGVKVATLGNGSIISPASSDFDLTGDFTIEFFAYANDANDYWDLIQLGDGITGERRSGWSIRKEPSAGGNKLGFGRYTESGGFELNLLYSFTPVDHVWTHIAVTRDSSAGLRFFVNGAQLTDVIEDVGSVEASKTISFTNPNNAADMSLTIGSAYFGDPNTIKYFNGKMAAVRVVKGSALYTSDFAVPTTLPTAVTGTQLLLNFGATAVPTIELPWYSDLSDAHHAVTLSGSVTQSDEGGGVKAALFDPGTLRYTASDYVGTTDFTLEFFVKPVNGTPGFREELFAQNDGGGAGGGFEIFKQSDGTFALGSYDVSLDAQTSTTITDTNWHHLAIVGVGGSVSLYIDGTQACSVYRDYTGTGDYTVGYGDYGPVNYYGKIAGLRMVLGTAVYTSNFTVPTTLPTAIAGTQLLLNFGATAAPQV